MKFKLRLLGARVLELEVRRLRNTEPALLLSLESKSLPFVSAPSGARIGSRVRTFFLFQAHPSPATPPPRPHAFS